MTAPSIEALIAAHPFIEGMRPEHVKTLAKVAMELPFDAGELILREGDPANRFYLILSGKVSIESHLSNGTIAVIQTLGGGDVLGWSWLFPPYTWQFDARATELGRAIFFYGTRLREECEKNPDLGYELLRRVSRVLLQRLQGTRQRLLRLRSGRH